MREQAGDATPMPPVTTQFGGSIGAPMSGDVRLIRPVLGEPTSRLVPAEETAPEIAEAGAAEQHLETELLPWEEPAASDIPWEEPAAAVAGEPAAEADFPWESIEAGSAEPAFDADTAETEAALEAIAGGRVPADEFPLDAFIIPEHPRHVPTGMEGQVRATPITHTPVTDLADRLEKLSHRLRVEDAQSVLGRLAAGDRLDAMLAGLLAGFLAGQK